MKTLQAFMSILIAFCIWFAGNTMLTVLAAYGQEGNPNDPVPNNETVPPDSGGYYCGQDNKDTGPYQTCSGDVTTCSNNGGHCSKYTYLARKCYLSVYKGDHCGDLPNTTVNVVKYWTLCEWKSNLGNCSCPSTNGTDIDYGTPSTVQAVSHTCSGTMRN